MRKIHVFILVILASLLLTSLTAPVFSQDIWEAWVDLFISSPEAGIEQILDLAAEDPEMAALILARVAERMEELKVSDPALAERCENAVVLTCVKLIDVSPTAAALAVAAIKESAPEIGERVEAEVVAAGLEEDYLRAASPVRP